jgi:hypothetical protein
MGNFFCCTKSSRNTYRHPYRCKRCKSKLDIPQYNCIFATNCKRCNHRNEVVIDTFPFKPEASIDEIAEIYKTIK